MLNLLSTPIGNLNDISLRAIDALKNADYIYAEDTRVTNKLLSFLKIEKKCRNLHEHNEEIVTNDIIKLLIEDTEIVLVSDAGTPAISDPGYYLVQQCIKKNIPFTLLPGPSSVISALVMSGLSTSSFSFHGFIPRKKNQKRDFFKSLRHEKNTVVLFESAKRIEDTLQVLIEEYSSTNKSALCREMTKLHETIERGTIEDVFQRLKAGKIVLKGEFVVVIECSSELKKSFIIDKKIKESFLNFLPAKDAAKLISLLTKENKRDIYKQLLD